MDIPFGIRDFLSNLLVYHYIFFILVFCIAVCILLLAVALRRHLLISALLYFCSFLSIFGGIPIGSYYLEEYVRSSRLEQIHITRLVYSKAIVVSATLHNTGRVQLKKSYIEFTLVKKNSNSIVEFFHKLSPQKRYRRAVVFSLEPGKTEDVRFILDTTGLRNTSDDAIYIIEKSF